MRALGIVGLLLVGTLLVGCSDEPSAESEDSPDEKSSECREVIQGSIDLAGLGHLSDEQSTDVGGLPACVARVEDSPLRIGRIQVIQVPATEWAESLPALVDQILETGVVTDPEALRKLKEGRDLVASSEAVTGKQACDLFTTLVVELQGLQPGARSVVNVLPDNQAPRAVNGQACSDGRYTGVQIESGVVLDVDPTMIDLVRSALTHYHQGPL